MLPYQAVLFDFDGVLIDSEPVHFDCWREVLSAFGIDFQWDTYRSECIGVSDRAMLEALSRRLDPPLDVGRLWGEYPRKQRLYRSRMLAAPPFVDGLAQLLESLSAYRLAVVSSSGRPEVEPLLEVGRLRPFFQAVVCGEDVARHKPDPEPYLLAARLLDVERALVVEDSAAGLESARAAGFDAVHVPEATQTTRLVRARLLQAL
jgi:beta-phosphoglucomutase